MNLPAFKSHNAVFIAALMMFAVGWIALYWIMANRVSAAEANAIALNGQQSTALQALDSQQSAALQEITNQLIKITGTLGKIEERTQQLNYLRDDLKQIREAVGSRK